MVFFIWKKNNVSFSRYQDFLCFCEVCRFQILWRHHKHCCLMLISYYLDLCLFLLNLIPIKMTFGQILVYCITNISNIFLAECGRLKTSSSPFYDFIKMTIQQDLAIFHGWHIPFLIALYSPFQKNETLESWHIWLLSNWDRLLNWKGPGI